MIHFSFARWTLNGDLIVLSNTMELTELLLETEGYENSPAFTDNTMGARYQFIWDDHHDLHNLYQQVLVKQKQVDVSLYLIEEEREYHQYFCLDFQVAVCEKITVDKKSILLLDFVNKIQQFSFCIETIKQELFPILEKKDMYSINVVQAIKNKSKPEQNHQKKMSS